MIKQKLNARTAGGNFAKQERDIFLRNSLRSSCPVSKFASREGPSSPSNQRLTSETRQRCLKSNEGRTLESRRSASGEAARRVGAVASLSMLNQERAREYPPYKNKYLLKKENATNKNASSFSSPNSPLKREVGNANPGKETSKEKPLAFIDLKCCKRVETPADRDNGEAHLAGDRRPSSVSTESEVWVVGSNSFELCSLQAEPKEDPSVIQTLSLKSQVEKEFCNGSTNTSSTTAQNSEDELDSNQDIILKKNGDTKVNDYSSSITRIPGDIETLQQDILAEVEKISGIGPLDQDSFECEDPSQTNSTPSQQPSEEQLGNDSVEANEGDVNNASARSKKMKRVSTYVHIFSKSSPSEKPPKTVKKSSSLGKELEDERKPIDKERSAFLNVFSRRRNIFEKKSDTKQEKTSKRSLIPSVHLGKDAKPSKHREHKDAGRGELEGKRILDVVSSDCAKTLLPSPTHHSSTSRTCPSPSRIPRQASRLQSPPLRSSLSGKTGNNVQGLAAPEPATSSPSHSDETSPIRAKYQIGALLSEINTALEDNSLLHNNLLGTDPLAEDVRNLEICPEASRVSQDISPASHSMPDESDTSKECLRPGLNHFVQAFSGPNPIEKECSSTSKPVRRVSPVKINVNDLISRFELNSK